jgi:flavin-dependent dehydrogenase
MPDNRAGVVIAGAGPAGSACALLLARSGVDVVTVERAAFPRAKTCGEYLNAGAVRLLDEIGAGALIRGDAAPVDALAMQDLSGHALTLRFCGESLSYPRAELDALLARMAREAGARTIRGRVEGLARSGGRTTGAVYRGESGERSTIEATFVVGADGARSLVARALGLARAQRGRERFALGGHFDGVSGERRALEMFVDGSSYLALNPLHNGQHNVMLVVGRQELTAARRDLAGFFIARARALGGTRLDRSQRSGPSMSFGPLASHVDRAWAPGAVLVGDAAGMIDPFTGQGVYIALRSGMAAAGAILRALAKPALADATLAAYSRAHLRDLTLRRAACAMVKTLIGTPALAGIAGPKLARRPEAARTVFEAVSGIGAIERAFDPRAIVRLVA